PRESTDVVAQIPARKAEREGLPAGYRMRADSHYVDQLLNPKTGQAESGREARRKPAPVADDHSEPRERRDVRDLRTERLFAQLGEDLASVESSVATLVSGASPTARRVMLDVMRAHTWRAGWLLRAQALTEGQSRGAVRSRPIGAVLARVREGFAAEG